MDAYAIQDSFAQFEARVRLRPLGADRPAFAAPSRLHGLIIDVRRDDGGELFDIEIDSILVDLAVLEVQPEAGRLLLQARYLHCCRDITFVCGQDEDGWFVAVVPDEAEVAAV